MKAKLLSLLKIQGDPVAVIEAVSHQRGMVMKRFATALTARKIEPVSEIKDTKVREWFEKVGLTTRLVTAAAPLVIFARSVDEANKTAISQSTMFPVKDGWYDHEACSVEIPEL